MYINRIKKILVVVILGFAVASTAACSQRMPKPKTAQGVIKSYFKDYGKKYKDSDFGQHKVDDVEVNAIQELQHEMVLVIAYVSLGDGDIVYKVGATLLKKTLFWRMLSWENLGRAS